MKLKLYYLVKKLSRTMTLKQILTLFDKNFL